MQPKSIFEKISNSDLDLRDTVILIQAGIEYHVNQLMLKKFGTDSFESERMNSKLMALNDVGIIDDTLRQNLIQIARIRHLFAHKLEVNDTEFTNLLKEISRKNDSGVTLREKFLSTIKQSYESIKQKDEEIQTYF